MSGNDEEIKVKITAPVARTFVWLLTFIGFILAAVAVRSCNFMEVHDDTSTSTTPTYFGLYRQENMLSNVCILYPSNSIWSSSHKAAGAMGIVSCILSGIVWLTMLCMACMKTPKLCWNILSIMLGIAFITESLQFIFFNDPTCMSSDVQCRLGSGGATAVASMIFLLLGTICMCCMKSPTKPAFILDLSDVKRDDSNNTDNNKTSKNFMGIIISKTKITNKKSPNDIEAGQGKGLTPAVVPASNLPQLNQQQPQQRMEQNIAPAVSAATTSSRGGPSAFDLTNLPTTDTADTGIPSNQHETLPPAVAFVPNEVDL